MFLSLPTTFSSFRANHGVPLTYPLAAGIGTPIVLSSGRTITVGFTVDSTAINNNGNTYVIPETALGGDVELGEISDIETIVIDGVSYTQSNSGEPGTFYLENGTIVVTAVSPINFQGAIVEIIGYPTQPINLRTNLVRTWQIGSLQGLFLEANISISRRFRDHPSASLTILCRRSRLKSVLSSLLDGQLFEINGFKFVSNGVSVAEPQLTVGDTCQVRLDLIGHWQYLSSQAVRLIDETDQTETSIASIAAKAGIPYLGAEITVPIAAGSDFSSTTTLSSLMGEYAIGYRSFPFWSNPNAAELRTWANFTPRNDRNTTAIATGGSALRQHTLLNRDIWSGIQYSYPVNSTQTIAPPAPQFVNEELKLDQSGLGQRNLEYTLELGELDADEAPDTNYTIAWKVQQANGSPENLALQAAAQKALSRADAAITLKSPTECFDAGGITKTSRLVTFRNGSIIRERRRTYGFVFTAIQVWRPINYSIATTIEDGETIYSLTRLDRWEYNDSLVGIDPSDYWQLVSEETLEYGRDSDGYIIRETVSKDELRRWRQEGDGKETIALWVQYANSDPDTRTKLFAELLSYHWLRWTDFCDKTTTSVTGGGTAVSYQTWRPRSLLHPNSFLGNQFKNNGIDDPGYDLTRDFIVHHTEGNTYYNLGNYHELYPHIVPPIAGEVPTKYLSLMIREQTGLLTVENPENILDQEEIEAIEEGDPAPVVLPPLATGEDYRESIEYRLIYPQPNTTEAEYLANQHLALYNKSHKRANREAAALGNQLKINTTEAIEGEIPTYSNRIPEYEEGIGGVVEPETGLANLVSSQNIRFTETIALTDYPDREIRGGSLEYRGTYTYEQALAAAEVDISIQATSACETLSLTIDHELDRIEEGDILIWNGDRYIVFQIQQDYTVLPDRVLNNGTKLGLNRLIAPGVQLSQSDRDGL